MSLPIDQTGRMGPVPTSALVVDLVSADDRAYFESNPGRRFRERPYVEGEFDLPVDPHTSLPFFGDIEAVLVERVSDRVRIRRPVFRGDTRGDVLDRTSADLRAAVEKIREGRRE